MNYRRDVAYFSYVVRHKWFVMLACFRCKLFWRGVTHDLSKFRPDEFFPYARRFYNPDGSTRTVVSSNYHDPLFDRAWALHQRRNKHHWEWWVWPVKAHAEKIMPMQIDDIVEMVCDWEGAGRAQGHGNDVASWYKKNKSKMKLHDETIFILEALIGQ